jgi:hypothetical protein
MATAEPSPRCPACGGANGCALVEAGPSAACWCHQIELRLPLPATPASCYCSACLLRLQAGPAATRRDR